MSSFQYEEWEEVFYRAQSHNRIDIMHDAVFSDDYYSADDKARMIAQTFTGCEFISRDLTYWTSVIHRFGFHMTAVEQAQYDALPEQVNVYRGYCGDSGTEHGISWTLDRERAEFFASKYFRTGERTAPNVSEQLIDKRRIVALCQERNESEVIILPLDSQEEEALEAMEDTGWTRKELLEFAFKLVAGGAC